MAEDIRNSGDGGDAIAAARLSTAAQARRALRALWLERAAQTLWPIWALVAAFLGLALIGAPQALPFWGHVAYLAGFALGFAWLTRRAWLGWRSPTMAEAVARLDGDARDRPAAAIGDALAGAGADPATQAIWDAHQRRMAERALTLRAAPADLRVSRQDRFALRHAAAVALAAGLIAQLGDGGARLAEALTPVGGASAAALAAPEATLEAWATPPVHTGVAPIYLTDRMGEPEPIALPAGTEIVLRVFDAGGRPALESGIGPVVPVETAEGAEAAPEAAGFADIGGGVWSAAVTLERSGALSVTAPGAAFEPWRFAALADAPPTIAFTAPPSAARGGALSFGFESADDYGVARATATVTLDADAPGPRGAAVDTVFEPVEIALPLPLRGAAEAVAETVTEDLTAHPWAGLPVVVTLTAEDGAGQTAQVAARTTLPGRRFLEPLAKALIEQRRELAWSRGTAGRVTQVLDAVTAHPDDVFDNASAYLMVRTARRRLAYAETPDALAAELPGVTELLWEAALLIEDGDLSDAERRLRELQEELSDALERGASDEEIASLMDELRQALQEFLQQLAQEALRNQAESGERQQQQQGQQLSQQDLMDMLDQLEQAMKNGMQDTARQMLEQLQQMLENLQMAQPGQQGQQGQGGPMQELQDMIGQQQGLADRSFDALRQGREGQQGEGQEPGQGEQPGQGQGQGQGQGEGEGQGQGQAQGPGQGQGRSPGGPDMGAIARDQEGLRQLLDELRRNMPGEGGAGEALERADRAMRGARDALEGGDADGALQDQVEALDALREGAQELAQEMQNQPGQSQQAGREGQSGDVREEDPFGRPTATDGPLDGESVRVPDAEAMKRARELLDEIRRRAGDRTRSPLELDYLQRLLERF